MVCVCVCLDRVMVNKEWTELDGTSAATPVFAGMLALIADARAVAGTSTLTLFRTISYGIPQLYTTLHMPCDGFCVVLRLTGS